MPKVKVKGSSTVKRNVKRKFRVGNAKGGKSALGMKTADLKEMYNDPKNSRYKHNIASVLRLRGVDV